MVLYASVMPFLISGKQTNKLQMQRMERKLKFYAKRPYSNTKSKDDSSVGQVLKKRGTRIEDKDIDMKYFTYTPDKKEKKPCCRTLFLLPHPGMLDPAEEKADPLASVRMVQRLGQQSG